MRPDEVDGNGGAEGTRTPDIHTASVVFSQLNYSPTPLHTELYHNSFARFKP